MTTLITGGSKCGKSSYAEKLLDGFAGRKIYIATMEPFGSDAQEAIKRHRLMRRGNGFETVERFTDIGGADIPKNCAVLLECVGNLCANEMFSGPDIGHPAERIVQGVRRLSENASELVIVTNQVGADGFSYGDGTAAYIEEMGRINAGLAVFADRVVECVYGIPVYLKGDKRC